jgi:hypothetical protein
MEPAQAVEVLLETPVGDSAVRVTDQNGYFRFISLTPGEYIVSSAPSSDAHAIRSRRRVHVVRSDLSRGSDARADIHLWSGSIRCRLASDQPSLRLKLLDSERITLWTGNASTSETLTITNVPPGHYLVVTQGADKPLDVADSQEVDVGVSVAVPGSLPLGTIR